jgi:hypothetical protein
MLKKVGETFSNQQFRMRVHTNLLMIMDLEWYILKTYVNLTVNVCIQRLQIVKLINLLGHLLMEKTRNQNNQTERDETVSKGTSCPIAQGNSV